MLNVQEALDLISTTIEPVAPSLHALEQALGLVLSESIVSTSDSPPFDKSMMDGYAVRACDLSVGDSLLQVVDEVTAGHVIATTLRSGEAIRIMTGAPIPAGADSVIPLEESLRRTKTHVTLKIEADVSRGLNIITRGSNMRSGECVIDQGRAIRSQEIALLAEMGQAKVLAHRRPRVAVLATGDELVNIDQIPGPGQIRNSNAVMLASQVAAAGSEPVVLGIARDDPTELREKIHQGLECDFLCLSGGVSAGKLDLVPSELAAAGVEQVFHKVAMKPGKPIWFGKFEPVGRDRCYVFGLPGNPVSSMVCFELFVRTALRRFSGINPAQPQLIQATLTMDVSEQGDREVWFPASLEFIAGQAVVTPVNWKGSSDLRSTVEANASVCLAGNETVYLAGTPLDVLPWVSIQN